MKNTENQSLRIKPGYRASLWAFFASIRLTVLVLLALAVLSVIGTLIPQNQHPADYLRFYGPMVYQIMVTLDIFDMYHSWWFQFLLLVLALNIIICSIDRLQATWRVIFPKTREFNLQNFRQSRTRREIGLNLPIEGLQAELEKRIKKRFSYSQTSSAENGFVIAAEKGRWTRLGVYGVHLSVVILLLGGLVGSKYGFEGYVNIPEGQATNVIEMRNTGQAIELGFAIQCDDFEVQFYEGTQRPKEFRSSLTILENGKPVVRKDIVVNDPLQYKGISIYQSSYGKVSAPPVAAQPEKAASDNIELSVQSKGSGMIYAPKVRIGEPIQLPEGAGQLLITHFEPAATFRSMDLGPAYVAVLTPKDGEPQTIMLPLRFPKFDIMRQGDMVLSISQTGVAQPPDEPRYYTGLQVAYDPGVWLVYTGFILMIAGCYIAFFMSHQRVVIEVQPRGPGVEVMVSGIANKNKLGFQQKLQRFADEFAALKNSGKADV